MKDAAEQFGVSRRLVASARKVLRESPDLLGKAVDNDVISVGAAVELLGLNRAAQEAAVAELETFEPDDRPPIVRRWKETAEARRESSKTGDPTLPVDVETSTSPHEEQPHRDASGEADIPEPEEVEDADRGAIELDAESEPKRERPPPEGQSFELVTHDEQASPERLPGKDLGGTAPTAEDRDRPAGNKDVGRPAPFCPDDAEGGGGSGDEDDDGTRAEGDRAAEITNATADEAVATCAQFIREAGGPIDELLLIVADIARGAGIKTTSRFDHRCFEM